MSSRSPTMRKVTSQLVCNVKMILKSEAAVPKDLKRPTWLGPGEPFPCREILAFPNRLMHLPTYVDDPSEGLIEPTPRFFSTRCLPFEFDPDPAPPGRWLEFLDEVFAGDEEAQGLVQEWFGYCLVEDTSQQKILMIVGPTRSGKSTIGRVLAGLLGEDSVAGTSFASLSERFGLETLIGRTVAVISDARLSGRSDEVRVVERLLNISGEDGIDVDRKNRDSWQGTLRARLLLLGNELPKLRDASLAMANRLLIAETRKSFLGQEDPSLMPKLVNEFPGILAWSIEGWGRLKERGHFLMPKSSRGAVTLMKGLSSPVATFVEQACVVGVSRRVKTSDLYQAFRIWSQKQEVARVMTAPKFGQALKASVAGLEHKRMKVPEQGGTKHPYYLGIGLRPEAVPTCG